MRAFRTGLRFRLLIVWGLSLTASIAVAVLLVQLYRQSTAARVGRAELVVGRACEAIRDAYLPPADGPPTASLPLAGEVYRRAFAGAVERALARQANIEGGIWQAETGALAYAFPTYAGSGPKTDLPAAERDNIAAVNQEAAQAGHAVLRHVANRTQTLLFYACPLPGAVPRLTAWTMARVEAAPDDDRLRTALAVLLGFMLAMSAWLGRTLIVWRRHVGRIEQALANAGPMAMPNLALTGESELDRIIEAHNEAGQRLAAARREAEALAREMARVERLASLGRVAAGVAHEIRNPLAAARLQGENGLAGDDARCRAAVGEMLQQIGRLDRLVAELLAMTQRVTPCRRAVDLRAFLAELGQEHRPLAAARHVRLALDAPPGAASFDPAMVKRIIDNLVTNALRHATVGGLVTVTAGRAADRLVVTVEDSGPGVPSELARHLFEPFVTGRAEGTGLGLAIARELADAHGGRLELARAGGEEPGQGALFRLELPEEGAACRQS